MHKRSIYYQPKPRERRQDRARAARALGKPLKPSQPIHHHKPGVIVICEDRDYHTLLHFNTYRRKLRTNRKFYAQEKRMASCCVSPPLWFNCKTWQELKEKKRESHELW